MKKIYIYAFFVFFLLRTASGQVNGLRRMYIDHFADILGNPAKEDSLLQYAQDSSFNYLALYDLHTFDFTHTPTADMMGTFIKRARDVFGITYVGAVGESFSSF